MVPSLAARPIASVLALDGAFFPLGINIAATRRGTCPKQALSGNPGRRVETVAPGERLGSGKLR